MGLWPLSWQWWCHPIFCANTQEWYGWQICLLRELKKLFSWQFFPKIQICPLWVLKFSAMCKSALRKKFDLIFWAQILVFQKFSFSHIWRTQKAIRICKKKSLKILANLPFVRVSAGSTIRSLDQTVHQDVFVEFCTLEIYTGAF